MDKASYKMRLTFYVLLSHYLRLLDLLTLSTLNPLFNSILNSRRKFIKKFKLFNGVLENRL